MHASTSPQLGSSGCRRSFGGGNCSTRNVVGGRRRGESFPSVPLSHPEIWTSFLWFLLVFGVWVLLVVSWINGFLGDGFYDVSVLYALLGPSVDTRSCVRLRDIWKISWSLYGPLYLAVPCSTLFVLEEKSSSIFWEITPRYVVFSASWFDSGYMFMSFYGGVGLFTEFLHEGGTRTLRSVRIISTAPRILQPLVLCCSGVQNMVFSGRSLPETLVRHWIQVYVSLRRLLEYLTCRARRRHGQW